MFYAWFIQISTQTKFYLKSVNNFLSTSDILLFKVINYKYKDKAKYQSYFMPNFMPLFYAKQS